jgi:UPF0042 nucleotide-binding protein
MGFYCVDNLPPELLASLVALERTGFTNQLAIAVDVRSASSLPLVPAQLAHLRLMDVDVRLLFLDATTEILVHRFSETRRRHPLSRQDGQDVVRDQQRDLVEAIELERELLSELREESHIIDTSLLRSSKLQGYIKSLISAPATQLTLMFESFAFKRGIPMDADYVFDVRMLPNPHYEPELRQLTGRDAPVAKFLQHQQEVTDMQADISKFVSKWLIALARDHRSYVTIAVGCTGGQHRSVYLVEQLAAAFGRDKLGNESGKFVTLKRHRELQN